MAPFPSEEMNPMEEDGSIRDPVQSQAPGREPSQSWANGRCFQRLRPVQLTANRTVSQLGEGRSPRGQPMTMKTLQFSVILNKTNQRRGWGLRAIWGLSFPVGKLQPAVCPFPLLPARLSPNPQRAVSSCPRRGSTGDAARFRCFPAAGPAARSP